MGFADYFSRHPTSSALPVSNDDKNFVINLIDSFKFILKRADKNSSNRIEAIIPAQNDKYRQVNKNKQSKSLLAIFVAQNSRSLLIHFS